MIPWSGEVRENTSAATHVKVVAMSILPEHISWGEKKNKTSKQQLALQDRKGLFKRETSRPVVLLEWLY